MVRPTSSPASSSGRTGHQTGSSSPSPSGRSVKTHVWLWPTSWRKKYAAAEIGTPSAAAISRMAT